MQNVSKWRPNVLILGIVGFIVVGLFGRWMTFKMGVPVTPELFAALIGTGLGPLIAIIALIATDSPPPTVPADVHERVVLGNQPPAAAMPVSLVDKLKPNVLILATLFVAIILIFGYMLVEAMSGKPIGTQILAMVVTLGISGLVTVIGYVAVDPPPPTVPASTHETIVLARQRD